MSDPKSPDAGPDLHMGNIAKYAAHKLNAQGVIVLVSNADGTIGMSAAGVNHARANEMFSVGSYMNLDQHYKLIRNGAAGKDAAEHLGELEHFERKGVTQ